MPATVDPDLEFHCPRCRRPVTERFYGPCSSCREELITRFSGEGSPAEAEVSPARFEPGMNVVPNHVATKD